MPGAEVQAPRAPPLDANAPEAAANTNDRHRGSQSALATPPPDPSDSLASSAMCCCLAPPNVGVCPNASLPKPRQSSVSSQPSCPSAPPPRDRATRSASETSSTHAFPSNAASDVTPPPPSSADVVERCAAAERADLDAPPLPPRAPARERARPASESAGDSTAARPCATLSAGPEAPAVDRRSACSAAEEHSGAAARALLMLASVAECVCKQGKPAVGAERARSPPLGTSDEAVRRASLERHVSIDDAYAPLAAAAEADARCQAATAPCAPAGGGDRSLPLVGGASCAAASDPTAAVDRRMDLFMAVINRAGAPAWSPEQQLSLVAQLHGKTWAAAQLQWLSDAAGTGLVVPGRSENQVLLYLLQGLYALASILCASQSPFWPRCFRRLEALWCPQVMECLLLMLSLPRVPVVLMRRTHKALAADRERGVVPASNVTKAFVPTHMPAPSHEQVKNALVMVGRTHPRVRDESVGPKSLGALTAAWAASPAPGRSLGAARALGQAPPPRHPARSNELATGAAPRGPDPHANELKIFVARHVLAARTSTHSSGDTATAEACCVGSSLARWSASLGGALSTQAAPQQHPRGVSAPPPPFRQATHPAAKRSARRADATPPAGCAPLKRARLGDGDARDCRDIGRPGGTAPEPPRKLAAGVVDGIEATAMRGRHDNPPAGTARCQLSELDAFWASVLQASRPEGVENRASPPHPAPLLRGGRIARGREAASRNGVSFCELEDALITISTWLGGHVPGASANTGWSEEQRSVAYKLAAALVQETSSQG